MITFDDVMLVYFAYILKVWSSLNDVLILPRCDVTTWARFLYYLAIVKTAPAFHFGSDITSFQFHIKYSAGKVCGKSILLTSR